MIKNVLTNIGGVDGYGIISLCLFFAFFLGMVWWALRLKKSYLNSMRGLPLDADTLGESPREPTSNPEPRHE